MDFTKLASLFLVYKYPIIFFLTLIEGPIMMTLSGLLLRVGLADFWPIYLVLIAGDLVGDSLWYGLGYYFGDALTGKYGKFLGLTEALVEKTKAIFLNHGKKTLFLSKITMGFGFPLAFLVAAGVSKMPFKKFIGSLFWGQLIFTGLLVFVGYFFGNLYVTINEDFKIISAGAFLLVIVMLMAGVKSYLQQRNKVDMKRGA